MSTPPTEGPTPPKVPPPSGPSQPAKPSAPDDEKDAAVLTSPFAKMFEKAGATPTAKQMREIINNILKQLIVTIKKSDESWKKSMRRIREAIEGK